MPGQSHPWPPKTGQFPPAGACPEAPGPDSPAAPRRTCSGRRYLYPKNQSCLYRGCTRRRPGGPIRSCRSGPRSHTRSCAGGGRTGPGSGRPSHSAPRYNWETAALPGGRRSTLPPRIPRCSFPFWASHSRKTLPQAGKSGPGARPDTGWGCRTGPSGWAPGA